MERKDVMGKNVAIYKAQASALEKHANKGVKVRAGTAGISLLDSRACVEFGWQTLGLGSRRRPRR